jgi:hypothetical protein
LEVKGVLLELSVGRSPRLKGPEPLGSTVRLSEQAQPDQGDRHDQDSGPHESDQQLDVDSHGQPPDRPDDRVVSAAQPSSLVDHG